MLSDKDGGGGGECGGVWAAGGALRRGLWPRPEAITYSFNKHLLSI